MHESTDVWAIRFDNGSLPATGCRQDSLGVTGSHPIYSLDANSWVLASTLSTGNQVLTKSGAATVTSVKKLSGRRKVYNLEVRDLHNFLVGDCGVVVHNAYLLKTCLQSLIGYLNQKATFLLTGTGKYKIVGGHHPLASKAFEGSAKYSRKEAFSVSNNTLKNA